MIVLRHVIGDELRRRRQDQGRTLREVSAAASVSLGYLSEVERGQKEASSELLAAICGALDVPLSDVLSSVSSHLADRQANARLVPGEAFMKVVLQPGAGRSGTSTAHGPVVLPRQSSTRSADMRAPRARTHRALDLAAPNPLWFVAWCDSYGANVVGRAAAVPVDPSPG